MSNKLLLFGFIVITTAFTSCSDKPVDAKEYFDQVIAKTDSVVTVFNSFIDGSTYLHSDSMNLTLKKIENTVKEQGALLANMKDFNEDATLRIAAISYVNQLSEISNTEFKHMITAYAAQDALQLDTESSKIDSIAEVMGAKVNQASGPFLKAQTAFASKNNMKLNFDYEIAPTMKKELDTNVIVK